MHSANVVRTTMMMMLMAATSLMAQSAAQPGPEHARLKQLEGSWDAVARMGDSQTTATSVHRMGPGGLWLISEFKADIGGIPFEGHGIDGYDQDRKRYVSVWVDSITSAIMTFEGTYDESSQSLTMVGQGKGADGQPVKYKSKSRTVDQDHNVFEMFQVDPNGKDNLMMTIEYTRKK